MFATNKNRFIEIDAIRGLSAIIILLYHYIKYIYSISGQTDWLLDIVEYGKYGVHFFFVISGFLIFMTLERSKHPGYFLLTRFSRLYPTYWICMALTALVLTFSIYYNGHPVTLTQFFANLTMFQHWMFIEDIDGVYWTLAVELCFYIMIFSVFIFRQQKHIERIGTAWLAIMILMFFLNKQHLIPPINYYYYVPMLRSGNLFFGGILFYQLKNNRADKGKYILLLLTLAVHFIINSTQEALVICFIYLVLYLFVIDKLKFLRTNVLYFLGFISYPLYLLHQYIGYEIINYLDAFGIKSMILKITLTAILIIATALLVTFTVEQPAMKFIRRKWLPSKNH